MRGLLDRAAVWLATGLGVGLATPAPGTVGGLWGLPLACAISQLSTTSGQLTAIVLLSLISVWICGVAARALGGAKDPSGIVLDEIVALPIVYVGLAQPDGPTWLVGWLLFRLFDIAKPPPVRWVERCPGGWGVVLDDTIAACYAWLALRGFLWLDRAVGLEWFAQPA